jgi:exocyst complex component 4
VHSGEGEAEEADLAFDPVSLALELLEPDRERSARAAGDDHAPTSSASSHRPKKRQNLTSFLRLKAELDNAIKSTLSPRMNPPSTTSESGSGSGGVDAYRAYETSISTHNAALSTLTQAQKLVGGMRTGLVTTRERLEGQLGAKEGGLAGMYARLGMLEEMGSLLDEM